MFLQLIAKSHYSIYVIVFLDGEMYEFGVKDVSAEPLCRDSRRWGESRLDSCENGLTELVTYTRLAVLAICALLTSHSICCYRSH